MKLHEAVDLGGLTLENRLIVAPMSRMQANDDGTVSPNMPTYYARYARHGAGMIMTEALYIDHVAARAYFNQPGLASDAQAESWTPVVRAVHAAGARIMAQLQHGGRLAEPGLNPCHLGASTGLAAGLTWQTGRPNAPALAATAEQIHSLVQGFAEAARRACAGGFDGVEIHGARGYLLDEFLSASTNQRTDGYGGSLEGRLRLPLEVVAAVREAIGDKPLSYNLSLYKMDDVSYQPPGGAQEVAAIVRSLEASGVDILHISTRKALRPEPWGETLVRTVSQAVVESQVIANGGLKTLTDCEQAMVNEGAHAVSLARMLLANADWLQKMQTGQPLRSYVPGMEREDLLSF
ncbi:MAG: NADH:flavin oxidoreductase [Pigmentiphaga sp.]